MSALLLTFALALLAAPIGGQPAPLWLGLVPSGPATVSLVELTDGAAILRTIGAIALRSAGEYVWQDALRCLPGYCLFSASENGASRIYKVWSANASLAFAMPAAGVCAHMHFDVGSRIAYTLCESAGGAWAVRSIDSGSGLVRTVGDVTAAVAGGAILPGQTTHCSATHHLYLGVSHGGGGKDVVLAVDTATGTVDNRTALPVDLFAALWASCDGSGTIGGLAYAPAADPAANGTLSFSTWVGGALTRRASASVPAGFAPNGVLTATSDRPAAEGNFYAATVYPPGHTTNVTAAEGFLWLFDPLGSDTGVDEVSEFNYNLISASWERSNWA